MTARLLLPALVLSLAGAGTAPAEGPALPPGDKEPFLRVEAGGPTSFVTALVFSPDGRRLYAGGWDKVVRAWAVNDQGRFVPDRVPAYRLPVGPGLGGAINALALSEDGTWLAAGGLGVVRGAAGFRQAGFLMPTAGGLSEDQLRDLGTIYVFNTRDQSVRLLRGHRGRVEALAFAPDYPDKPPLLLSAAVEPNRGKAGTHTAVRLWDVSRGESVAELSDLPPTQRPGMTAWHVGKQVRQVRVALALEDGVIRVWDARQDEKLYGTAKVSLYTRAVARLPEPGPDGATQLLTAEPGQGMARLTLWNVPAEGAAGIARRQPPPAHPRSLPRALGLLSRRDDHRPDLAAVVLQIPPLGQKEGPDRQDTYRLQIVDLGPDQLGTVLAKLDLWTETARLPALATSLRGRCLAVAGNQDHEIRIFALEALLNEGKEPSQVLRGSGITFHHVAFVRKGDELGLLLNRARRKSAGDAPPAPDPDKDDLVFPFARPRLSADLAGWETSAPDPGDWQARPTVDGRGQWIAVYKGEQARGRVLLKKDHALSDYALLPPHGAVKVPLLALATHELGRPRLEIYDGDSGALLRQLTGHVERVYALAFSADGRLLASASEDQTVRVWSLTDLDALLGRHGRLPGVQVKQDKGALVVEEAADDSKLRPGDVIAGLVERGKLRPLDSPWAFYFALFRMEPGQKVTLRRGDPAGKDDVTLTVGQGADERKPLFSLFAVRSDRGDRTTDADWIGWNPIGPYESSSPRAERFLGWHFNTGDPKMPARFALAATHQKDYYRPGILQKLVAQGKLDRVELLPPARPAFALLVEEEGRPRPIEKQGPLVVSHPRVALKLEVRDRPLQDLEALTWKLDDGDERPLPLGGRGGRDFEVPLKLGRGDHQVVLTATTRDRPPQAVPVGVALRYQPPRPQVEYDGPKGQRFVREAAFDLKAVVRPTQDEEPVTVSVHQWHDGKDVLAGDRAVETEPGKPLAIERHVELRPGNNVLEIVAVNRDAPRGQEAKETARLTLEVLYTEKAGPPVIALTGVRLPGAGKAVKVESSQPVVVHAPEATLLGTVEASEELTEAEWRRDGAGRGTPLTGFEPGKAKTFALAEKLALRPGPQTFLLRARTETSPKTERSVTVDYRPLLPAVGRLKLVEPQPGDTFYGEADTLTVRVEGRVVFPADRQPYRAVVLVNGKESAAAPALDEKTGTLSAAVVVGPGDSYIRVRLSNAWGMTADGANEVHVRYLRPPRILEVKRVQADGKPVLNLEARVKSPLPLREKSVHVEVNGQDVPAVKVKIRQPENGVGLLRLEGVPLEAGRKASKVAVRVSNAEAECREPGTITVETATVLPPPVVEILEPGRNLDVSRPELSVSYHIRSASPLTAANLIVEGQPPLALDVAKAVRDEDSGQFELAGEAAVTLKPSFNHLRLEAVNGSGRRITDPVVVNYVPPPFRLVAESLEPVKGEGEAVAAVERAGGRIEFPGGVAAGHVRLHGHIRWADAATAAAHEGLRIRVFVNGFQQTRARLEPAEELQTPFTADLLLNWQKNNHVSLVAPGQDADNRCEFDVDCRQPVARQRLHLLVLSPEGKDADGLEEKVLDAVGAKPVAGRLRTPAFDEVKPYEPLVGAEVQLSRVYSELYILRNAIAAARVRAPMNDVVMIYYQGGETVDDRGNVFHAPGGAGPAAPQDLGIPCDKLVDFLADTPGAHLLLLDVERGPLPAGVRAKDLRDKIEHWDDYYPEAEVQFSVLRYLWQDRGGRPPPQARLLAALGKVLPQAARLSDLMRLLGQQVAAGQNAALLVYTRYAPPDLEQLVVGKAP